MSQQNPEPEPVDTNPTPQAEPLKFDPPTFDYIEKGGDNGDYETRTHGSDETR